ncbi:hypothetical protein BU041_07865 [Staphylococcus simulans]|uniref:hypothetical protein n=2 Tax=Staphylococcus simulans TaxID=1286 RepID=UPI000D1EDC58|nr:hypothetical protein [Staphylococcus simulans]PTI87493.1 hypothetical protein BU053_05025 [Staphylococcus simulans]RIN50074.1 hypothetical protein BU041_07865 [Staphylococcus simulans]
MRQSSNKMPRTIMKYCGSIILLLLIVYYLYKNYGSNLFRLDIPTDSSMYYIIHLDWNRYAEAYVATLTTIIIPLFLIGIILFILTRLTKGKVKNILIKILPLILFIALFVLIFVPMLFVLNVTHFSFLATFLSFLALSKPAMVKIYRFSQKSVDEINHPEINTTEKENKS